MIVACEFWLLKSAIDIAWKSMIDIFKTIECLYSLKPTPRSDTTSGKWKSLKNDEKCILSHHKDSFFS